MSKLNLKIVRDIRSSPLMFMGVVLLLLAGIALYGASYALYTNLQNSYTLSYRMLNLADFIVPVRSAPDEIISTLRRIPGVRNVEGRTIREVEIKQPGMSARKVSGRIISLPDTGEPAVNQFKLIAGNYPGMGTRREILLEAAFAKYYKYEPGDYLTIIVEDDELRFRIVGIVQSPEYIVVVRGRESPYPSESTFAVIWMRRDMVDELFDTSGSYNEIDFTMIPGGNRRTAMRLAERILKSYGAGEAIPLEDQPSVELLRLDLIGLKNLAIFFPILFLTIASLSVYNMLGRMVHAQQGQIGFLRAVGYSRSAVGLHYLMYATIIGASGGVCGAWLGYYLGTLVTRFYTSQIQVPYFDISPRWAIILSGFLIATLVTVVSSLFPALAAARMTPAEAITTTVPVAGRAPIIERLLPFLWRFSLLSRLPLRNFLRNPRRTISTVAGVASAATLLLVSSGLLDSTFAAIDFYFKYSIHYDIMAVYLQPKQEFSIEQIRRWPGVRRVEPMLAIPAKITFGQKDQTILIYGVEPGSRMISLSTNKGVRVPIAPEGLMVAQATAKKLGLWNGGSVLLSLPRQTLPEVALSSPRGNLPPELTGGAPTFRETVFSPGRALLETDLNRVIRISGITYQPVGIAAYASIDQVRAWFGGPLELPPKAINSVLITADPAYVSTIEKRLYRLDGIASVQVIRTIRREIDKALQQSNVFFNIMLAFSVALAGVIIFNATLMNVIERTREIATLRTVGISVSAASHMIWVENLLAFIVGILVGLPLGSWLADVFVRSYESESFNMQTVIFFRTYLITVLGVFATVIFAQIPGIRYIRDIELAKATKDIG